MRVSSKATQLGISRYLNVLIFEEWTSVCMTIPCFTKLISASFNFEMFGRTITEKKDQAGRNAFEFHFMYNSYIYRYTLMESLGSYIELSWVRWLYGIHNGAFPISTNQQHAARKKREEEDDDKSLTATFSFSPQHFRLSQRGDLENLRTIINCY